jgi:hypothetical protein
MHKLCDYLTDELKEMEDKVARGGKLSRTEIEDGKNIAKFKMALLTNDRMEQDGGESEMYPYMGGYRSYTGVRNNERMSDRRGMSNAQRRDSRGRYSGDDYSREDARDDFIADLREVVMNAPDEHMKKRGNAFIRELQNA